MTKQIIPALAILIQNCPVHMGQILPGTLLHNFDIPTLTLCSDLKVSDNMFDRLKFKYVAASTFI